MRARTHTHTRTPTSSHSTSNTGLLAHPHPHANPKAHTPFIPTQPLPPSQAVAKDLGLVLDKTIKLEWHKAANTRTRCLRITQKEEKAVRSRLQAK